MQNLILRIRLSKSRIRWQKSLIRHDKCRIRPYANEKGGGTSFAYWKSRIPKLTLQFGRMRKKGPRDRVLRPLRAHATFHFGNSTFHF